MTILNLVNILRKKEDVVSHSVYTERNQLLLKRLRETNDPGLIDDIWHLIRVNNEEYEKSLV